MPNVNKTTEPIEIFALKRLTESGVIPREALVVAVGSFNKRNKSTSGSSVVNGIDYNFDLSNTNVDLKNLTKKLKYAWAKKKTPFSMLLYGVSGAGKSYYAKFLAQELGLKFLKKKASDLFGKLVGETEENIRSAFKEAEEQGAILVIDEADSMLYDRTQAHQDHQVAHVNEMLVQMETFKYPFICTTNLVESMDMACFRRFVFKVKFDYLSNEKVKNCIKFFFNKSAKNLPKYDLVCAGDFFNIKRRLDILCDKITLSDIKEALTEELSVKPEYKFKNKKTIGFSVS